MTGPELRLRKLAADCLVRVGTDIGGAPEEGGSGVWIAPGTILTCAHVVPAALSSKVQVGWRDYILTGTVTDQVRGAPGVQLWPYPDMAVIAVDGAPEHPCAWLSEAVPVRGLVAFGHSAALGEGLRPAEVEGWRGGVQAFGDGHFWQFKGNELVAGMSGGPVLDLSSGAVCGIVSATIGEAADRGGYVVPVRGLRFFGAQRWQELLIAHDRFHGRERNWTALRAGLPLPPGSARCPVTPSEEVELLALLAQFPAAETDTLITLIARNCIDGRMPALPGALRDVVYALLDSGALDSESVMSVLQMTHHLVGAVPKPAHLDLYNWATALAARHQLLTGLRGLRRAPAGEDVHGGVISVEIAPGLSRMDRFRLTVSVQQHHRGHWPIHQDQEPVHTLEEVEQLACDQLRVALGWLAGNARVEFVVPSELFDEPFDELMPTKPYTNLGRKYHVVLRDYDRQFDREALHNWRQRWQRLQNPGRGIRWINCADDLTPDEFSAELEQHPETAVVALTRSPSSSEQASDMLRVALDSGMPVAVWCRGACPDHNSNDAAAACPGRRFQLAFSPHLSAAEISGLPEMVRQLRNRAAMKSPAAEDRDCRGTVLLWDDPARATQPIAMVHEPPYQPPGSIE